MNCHINKAHKLVPGGLCRLSLIGLVSVQARCKGLALLLVLLLICACGKQAIIPPKKPAGKEETLFQQADHYFQQGAYEEALMHYGVYVNDYPHAVRADDALIKIATIYMRQNRFQDARQHFERVINEYGNSLRMEEARLGLLDCDYREGDYSAVIEQAKGLAPETLSQKGRVILFRLLGNAYLAGGAISDAVYAYGMGYYYAQGSEKQGMLDLIKPAIGQLGNSQIEKLLSGPAHLPKGYLLYQLGVNRLQEGQRVAAAEIFTRFLMQYPDHELAAEAFGFMKNLIQIPDDQRFAIGCLLPLTGTYQTYGERALRGIELALAKRHSQFERPNIRLIVKDTASDSTQAVQALSELYQAQVSAVIGPIVAARAAAEAAQEYGLPMIVLSGKEAIADMGDWVFRNFLTPRAQMKTIAQYLCHRLRLGRFAVLYPDEKYGHTFMNLFWDEVMKNNGTVVGCESYPIDVTDFADPIRKLVGLYYEIPEELKLESLEAAKISEEGIAVGDAGMLAQEHLMGDLTVQAYPTDDIDRLLSELDEEIIQDEENEGDVVQEDEEPKAIVDFDAVFIPDSPKKVGLIAPQLAYYDVENVIFVGTNLWHSKELIQMARKYVQRAIMADGFYDGSRLPHVQQFVQSYSAIYGDSPGFIEAVAYDTANILFDLMGRPDFSSRYSLKEALSQLEVYPGVTGETSFDASGESQKRLYLLQIKGGRFKEIPESFEANTLP